jgi:hypothetical protein
MSADGLAVDDSKTAVIAGLQPPRNVSELRSLLGICNYYKSFCPDFAGIAEPLIQLLRKNVVFEWTFERNQAFVKLKAMLTSPPTLGILQDEGDLVLEVDASLFSSAAILQQYQEKGTVLRVLGYTSRHFLLLKERIASIVRK